MKISETGGLGIGTITLTSSAFVEIASNPKQKGKGKKQYHNEKQHDLGIESR